METTPTRANKALRLITLLAAFFIASCASVPRDAYRLNKEVGEGLQAIHQSNIAFTQNYFEQKGQAITSAEQQATSAFFARISMAAQNPSAPPINADALSMMESEILAIQQLANNKRQQLHSAEQTLLSKLNDDYAALAAANKELSAMLKTIHDIEAAKTRSVTALNLNKLQSTLDQHLSDGLEPVSETTALLDAINELLEPND